MRRMRYSPPNTFGNSTNTWCYNYQRAALAEQRNQWSDIIPEYKQAGVAGFSPEHPSEWLRLIKAHIHLGDMDAAMAISEKLEIGDELTLRSLCAIWKNSDQVEAFPEGDKIEEMLDQWQCEGK